VDQAPTHAIVAEHVPRFRPPDVVWYFGALVAAGAGEALIGSTSAAQRGVWMLLVGLVVMGVFGLLAAGFLRIGRRGPGGVLAAAVVWLAPATEVGFEHLFGIHPRLGGGSATVTVPGVGLEAHAPNGGFHGALFSIAMGTAVLGLVVYGFVRFGFVLLPVAISLAVAVLLFVPAVVSHPGGGVYVTAALLTGIVFFVAGLLLDARKHRRDAFWWYVVGLFEIADAFAYYLIRYHHGWIWLVLLVVSAVVLAASAPVGRAAWAVYAVVGVYAAVVHFVDEATGSWRTTLVLTIVGLLLVLVGAALDLIDSALVSRVIGPWLRPGRAQPPP